MSRFDYKTEIATERTMHKAIGKVSQLDENNWLLIKSISVKEYVGKGAFILQVGQICQHIFFLQTGLLRSFYTKEGDERNVAFTQENSFATDLKSLRSGQPAELSIQALEPSALLRIAKTDLIDLYQQSHQIETFGRRVLEALLEEQEEYASWFTRYSAKERYDLFVQKEPALLQRLSLSQIASFLGIRRETLSRIRRLA